MTSPTTGGWTVDTDGFSAGPEAEVVVDVLFDDRRIWSVAVPPVDRPGQSRKFEWPARLVRFLDGQATVALVEHHSDTVLTRSDLTFGTGNGRVEVADREGRPLVIDKWGFLQRPFDLQDPSVADDLLGHAADLLDILNNTCMVPAWVAFGSLLGAVRDGRVIGHDNDVDLAYLSRHEVPVDIAREMFGITRALRTAGHTVVMKSSSFVTVITRQSDGSQRDIDIYACFYLDDYLYETASLRAKVPREAILPLTTVSLEGRELAAPADPERLLEASYGPNWRVPDPSFQYRTPREVTRRFNGWFGSLMKPRRPWENFYQQNGGREELAQPSAFATWVAERESQPTTVVDVGCGNGRDSLHFARNGHRVLGFDFARTALHLATKAAAREDLEAEFEPLTLHDLRDTLPRGALLARDVKPRVLYARLLVDVLSVDGRMNLWRLADMTLRGGGRLYLEFRSGVPGGGPPGSQRTPAADADLVIEELRKRDAELVVREEGTGLAVFDDQDPKICRLVFEWSGSTFSPGV